MGNLSYAILITGSLLLVVVVCLVLGKIGRIILSKRLEIVKQHSQLYRNLVELNDKYEFIDIPNQVKEYHFKASSKRNLEKFDMDSHISDILVGTRDYYKKIINDSKFNKKLYSAYLTEFGELVHDGFTTETKFNLFDDIKFSYDKFVNYEKIIVNNAKKKKPTTDIVVRLIAEYTSPAGRNYYERKSEYHLKDIISLLNSYDIKEERRLEELKIKRQKQEIQRQKQQRLRQIDKLEREVARQKEELVAREKEFLEATKGHIYTSNNISTFEETTGISDSQTILQKMHALKEKFDCGEIDYKEYTRMREEIL